MVTQEDHLRLQCEFQDAHNKLGDRIASLAVDFKEYQRNTTSSFDELKAMLSSRRHRSSSSASSHRSSRHHKSNHEAHAQTHHRNGKEPQNFATERERRNHMSRHVHEAFNHSTQHQGASTYHASPPAMKVEIQRHIPMCHKTSAHHANNPRFDNLTCLHQLSDHWKATTMLHLIHRSTTKTTITTTTITMIGELDHLRLLSISGFANTHQMKSVLGA